MENEVTNEKPATVLIELPATIKATVARGKTIDLDLTKLDNTTCAAIIDYWAGVVSIRAGAGKDFADKVKAEQDMNDRLAIFDWTPGAGGGMRIDEDTMAYRMALSGLFESIGYTAKNAEKAAAKKTGMVDFYRVYIARVTQNANVEQAAIDTAIADNAEYFNTLVTEAHAKMKAERERNTGLKAGLKIPTITA